MQSSLGWDRVGVVTIVTCNLLRDTRSSIRQQHRDARSVVATTVGSLGRVAIIKGPPPEIHAICNALCLRCFGISTADDLSRPFAFLMPMVYIEYHAAMGTKDTLYDLIFQHLFIARVDTGLTDGNWLEDPTAGMN